MPEIQVGRKSLEERQHYGNRLLTQMKKIPYLRDLRINQPLSYPTIQIKIDRERAAQLNVSIDEIAKSLVAATSSSRFTAKNLWLDESKGFAYQVQVEMEQQQMNTVADIQSIPLVKGQLRPTLGDVATITPSTVPGEYDRIGARRTITVSANITTEWGSGLKGQNSGH